MCCKIAPTMAAVISPRNVEGRAYMFCPWAAVREERIEEEKEVARDLLDDVQESMVPGHVNPQQLMTSTALLLY